MDMPAEAGVFLLESAGREDQLAGLEFACLNVLMEQPHARATDENLVSALGKAVTEARESGKSISNSDALDAALRAWHLLKILRRDGSHDATQAQLDEARREARRELPRLMRRVLRVAEKAWSGERV